jgi:hypothetical protein
MAGTLEETIDIDCVDDFKAHMPTVSGRVALMQRLARRLSTPRGKLPFWPNFGTDMSQFLLSKVPDARISNAARTECLKDEQVEDCTVVVEHPDSTSLRLVITVLAGDGPFTFTMTISEAERTLVQLQQAV